MNNFSSIFILYLLTFDLHLNTGQVRLCLLWYKRHLDCSIQPHCTYNYSGKKLTMPNNTTMGLGAQVRLLEGSGLTLVLLLSLLLNLSVCGIIWRTRQLRNKPTNTFVANLCIANLLLTACVIPFSLATVIQDQHGGYTHILCQVT